MALTDEGTSTTMLVSPTGVGGNGGFGPAPFRGHLLDYSDTHYITYTAIFAALAGVLMLLEIPLFFAPGFYKMDLSELPVLLCSFYLGPVAGATAEFLKVFIKQLKQKKELK